MLALNKFTDVFDHIQPYQQKELLRLVLHKVVLSQDKIRIALYGRPHEIGQLNLSESGERPQIAAWLPRLLSQSVLLWDGMRLKLERIAKGHTRMILEDKLPRNLLINSPYGGYLYPFESRSSLA